MSRTAARAVDPARLELELALLRIARGEQNPQAIAQRALADRPGVTVGTVSRPAQAGRGHEHRAPATTSDRDRGLTLLGHPRAASLLGARPAASPAPHRTSGCLSSSRPGLGLAAKACWLWIVDRRWALVGAGLVASPWLAMWITGALS